MKTKYEWNTAFELPIGGGCRYFLNDSIIHGTYTGTDTTVQQNTSVIGSHRLDESYEIYDGTVIAAGIVYTIHDESQDLKNYYIR